MVATREEMLDHAVRRVKGEARWTWDERYMALITDDPNPYRCVVTEIRRAFQIIAACEARWA